MLPLDNIVQNNQFDSLESMFNKNSGTTSWEDGDQGWFRPGKHKWYKDNENFTATAGNKGAGGLTQVIKNDAINKGLQIISFDATNFGTNNTLQLQIYGVNGQFELSNWRTDEPTSATAQPIEYTTLLDTGNIANEEFDWKNISQTIDFDPGYEYIAVRFFTDGVEDSELMAIDNVVISNVPQNVNVIDSDFAMEDDFGNSSSTTDYTEAGQGWLAPGKRRWNVSMDEDFAFVDASGAGGLTQVIEDNNFAKGLNYISFDGINRGLENILRLEVYGINGEFEISNWRNELPTLISDTGEIKTLLDTGNVATGEFNWTKFTKEIDFEEGYQYIAVKFTGDEVNEEEFAGIDNFVIADSLSLLPVNENNNFPNAGDDLIRTYKNSPSTINVLDNDVDPEGDKIFIESYTQPANGAITLNEDGSFTYVPNNNLTGQDSFTYTIVDEQGAQDTATVEVTVTTPTFDIGVNLNGVNYFSPQHPFLDIFKTARKWVPQTRGIFDTGEYDLLDLDENGWVKSLPTNDDDVQYERVITTMSIDSNSAGNYLVLYEGEGTIEYSRGAELIVSNPEQGRDLIQIAPSERIEIAILETDPNSTGDYLRNIRVVPEESVETYQQEIFNPDFLRHIESFSTLRFMDWMQTNNSEQSEWQNRTIVDDYTYFKAGSVPVEIMVELANQNGSNPWFTMPHLATDEYVENFAQYVKENLDPELDVYVEYSNEVWNFQFQQAKWINEQATAEGLRQQEWYSRRTTEITRIWDQVFAEDKKRVLGVMAAQAGNPFTGETSLSYSWADQPLANEDYGIDVIAIAPYFGRYIGKKENTEILFSWAENPEEGLDNLFDEINYGGLIPDGPKGGALQGSYNQMNKYIELAEEKGLQLVAYEGGQHLVADVKDPILVDFFAQANNDPRMGEAYKEYFETWFNLGAGQFASFSDVRTNNKFGSWGLTEGLNQSSPKYDAVLELIDTEVNKV